MKQLILSIAIVCLAACSNNPQAAAFNKSVGQFASSPAGQGLIYAVTGAALAATINVGSQYASTGKIDSQAIVGAALNGSASALRALEGTALASNAAAITSAVTTGANVAAVSSAVAPAIVSNVKAQIASGVTPSDAVEHAAVALDVTAANPPAK